MTEGNTELTLHDESVETLIKVLYTISETGKYRATQEHAAELGTIGGTIRSQKPARPSQAPDAIIALCGLPGAGKSYVADKLSRVYDCPIFSMGDAIRRHAPDGLESAELGEWAAQTRDDDAEQIPKWAVEMVRGSHPNVAIVDGVRSTTDYEVLADYFDVYLIRVKAPFYTRLERLQERGREGEDEFDAVDLAERDENELNSLGYSELLVFDPPMLTLTNGRREGLLRQRMASLVNENLPFEQENPEPLLPPVGGKSHRRKRTPHSSE